MTTLYPKVRSRAGATVLFAGYAAFPVAPVSFATHVVPSGAPNSITQCDGCPPMVRIARDADSLVANMLVGQTELTWREYLVAVDEANCPAPRNPYPFDRPINIRSPAVRDDYPMTSIRPEEIDCYLGWLRTKSGKPYRLPTEREWQAFAAIGFPPNITLAQLPAESGYILRRIHSDEVGNDVRYVVRSGYIVPAGRYRPSPAGLYDLFGNAREITSDRELLPRKGGGEPFSLVIVKGGDILSLAGFHALSDRSRLAPSSLIRTTVGFRFVCKGC